MGLEFLLDPISEGSPCGADLEYSDDFRLLEEAARGKPASVVDPARPGASIPAVPPDWNEAHALASGILARSKDLRALTYLIKAELALHGLASTPALFDATCELLRRYWDGLFPVLEDGDDAFMRVNALSGLVHPDDFLKQVRETVLFRHGAFGAVSFRNLEIALGLLDAGRPAGSDDDEATDAPELTSGEASAAVLAGLESDPSHLLAVAATLEAARRLQATLDDMVGSVASLDFKPLFQRLKPVADFIAAQQGGDAAQDDETADASAAPLTRETAQRPAGEMNRQEAKKQILKICEFLEKTEPSSPAPIFLRRAVALMDMSFLDIVQELAPESLGTFKHYGSSSSSE